MGAFLKYMILELRERPVLIVSLIIIIKIKTFRKKLL